MKVSNISNRLPVPDGGVIQTTTGWAHSLAIVIAHQIIPANPDGFTFDPRRQNCLPLSRNTNPEIYVVSIKGHELRLAHAPTDRELERWIMMRWQLLLHQNHFVGGWLYLTNYFLDVSVLVSGKAAAESFARQQKQLKFYHPASGQSLEIEK
jgi:hypothetical protein